MIICAWPLSVYHYIASSSNFIKGCIKSFKQVRFQIINSKNCTIQLSEGGTINNMAFNL